MPEPIRLTEWSCGLLSFWVPELGIKVKAVHESSNKLIVTSPVERAEGRLIWTLSGSVYELAGQPIPEWLEYLEQNGWTYNDAAPFESKPPAPPKSLLRRIWEAVRRA